MARINLSSRRRWRAWHDSLRILNIQKQHLPTLGADVMLRPPEDHPGDLPEYRAYTVQLAGSEADLGRLQAFVRSHARMFGQHNARQCCEE
jgi:hypothetical protein